MTDAGRYQYVLEAVTLEQPVLQTCLTRAEMYKNLFDSVDGLVSVSESFDQLRKFVNDYNSMCERGSITNDQTHKAATVLVEKAETFPKESVQYRNIPKYIAGIYEYPTKVASYVESMRPLYSDRMEQIEYICDTYMNAFVDLAVESVDSLVPKAPNIKPANNYYVY